PDGSTVARPGRGRADGSVPVVERARDPDRVYPARARGRGAASRARGGYGVADPDPGGRVALGRLSVDASLSTRRLYLFLAVALPVVAALAADLPAVDLAYHLRAGESILATGAIPTVDTYTFTAAGERWLDQNWGAQVVLALAFRIAGWTALAILRAVLVGLTFGFVLVACRRLGAGDRTAALLTLGAFVVSSFTLALRPQLFGIAIFAAILLLTTYRRDRPRLLWLAVPLILVWANMHGSFVLGIGLLGLVWIADVAGRVPGSARHLALGVA